MTNNRVEETLVEGLKQLIKKYDWLEVRYEYSEERGVFLVSYGPKSETSGSEDFASDAIAFEDRVNDSFGDDAPLFCNGEELFELSPSAHTLGARSSASLSTFSTDVTKSATLWTCPTGDHLHRSYYQINNAIVMAT